MCWMSGLFRWVCGVEQRIQDEGKKGTTTYRVYVHKDARSLSDATKLSPWFDVPLRPKENPELYNFVVEIPKGCVPVCV